jgi:hypothetical protein
VKVPGGNVSQWKTPKQTELTKAWPTGPPTHVHQSCCMLGQVLPTNQEHRSTGEACHTVHLDDAPHRCCPCCFRWEPPMSKLRQLRATGGPCP